MTGWQAYCVSLKITPDAVDIGMWTGMLKPWRGDDVAWSSGFDRGRAADERCRNACSGA
jgi:hypothetical protein